MSHVLFSLKPLLIITVLGLVVALIGAVAFAWLNPASKTIALATAALLGAAALFSLQLGLELRGSEESDLISVEFIIDRAKPEVMQDYSSVEGQNTTALRDSYEHYASEWLVENSPAVFEDPERLTRDFALAELLLFFTQEDSDWRFTTTGFTGSKVSMIFKSGSRYSSVTAQPFSEKSDYTEVAPADFLAALRKAGNTLAGYESPMFEHGARFPGGTTMILGDRSLTLSNRLGSLQFTILQPFGAGYSRYEPQSATRLFGIRIVNRQNALYSQHRDAAKQAAWRKRVMSGLHSWFEPRQPATSIAPTPTPSPSPSPTPQ